MSSHNSPRPSVGVPLLIPLGTRSRRGSLTSLPGGTPVDKEQLAQALDKIHSTACQSETLTTFNEFAPPPPSSSNPESKGLAGDIIQNGLSGLYSRFKGAVGVGKDKAGSSSVKGDNESFDTTSVKSQNASNVTPTSKGSSGPGREDSGLTTSPIQLSTASSQLQSPTVSSFMGNSSEIQSQAVKSSKASLSSAPLTSKSATRPINPMAKTTSSSVIVPTVAPVNAVAFKEGEKARLGSSDGNVPDKVNKKIVSDRSEPVSASDYSHPGTFGSTSASESRRFPGHSSVLDDSESFDFDSMKTESAGRMSLGNFDSKKDSQDVSFRTNDASTTGRAKSMGNPKTASSALSSIKTSDSRPNAVPRLLIPENARRTPAVERITQSHLPGYQASRASSTDRSTAEASPIHTSAHNHVRHDSFGVDERSSRTYSGRTRIPGTTTNGGSAEVVSARLEQMRKQVLSKEFWMADDICKECFLCGDPFTAFRRKHHCRTCGCIFDSKCTYTISGQRFGVQGSLRMCKTCLDIINRRHDSSGSEDSDDESGLPTFFHSQQAKFDSSTSTKIDLPEGQGTDLMKMGDESRPLATPMMAIPATRRIGDSSNRRSAILEIDAPQLSRPSSSRSLKALSAAARPPSSSHRRHQSKHNFLGRFKTPAGDRAPFHRGLTDDIGKGTRLPAFHDDNIIDPDLAPYMSDEGSSADEQMSIFATLNNSNTTTPAFENDRAGFGSLLNATKRHRARTGDKSVSGISFTSRGLEDASATVGAFTRPNRRRNLSVASNTLHHTRPSPRQMKPTSLAKGFGNVSEEVATPEHLSDPPTPAGIPSKMTRSSSMRDSKAPAVELNNASLHHVRRLLHQLLEDADVPNVASWEKALIPILLQCTDDVNPDVRRGDDIDIRHYVKLKKIPGGKPGDTAYVSGVVFTKNLALKSMPRSISNPRIVIVSFPIEYQRHQSSFMSLEPVIAQEKEFLRNMVNRIASLRPQLLLVQKHISGLALQYLAEANIAVIYNVKPSVIEAVSRCAQTEVISSIDMVALKPVHIGKSSGFDVKTYVHGDIPGRKKTYIYLSGCPKELGCTIALRGASMPVLAKMKQITEFMVYVVYNLKLETCLMRDEFVLIPSVAESGNLSPARQTGQTSKCTVSDPLPHQDPVVAASNVLQAAAESEKVKSTPHDELGNSEGMPTDKVLVSPETVMEVQNAISTDQNPEVSRMVSAHESHVHASHDDHLPEDVPMPTFYSDMVAKHQTKILSASPFVKFVQPYLLVRAREQERRLVYLKRLRDQDTFEEQTDTEKSKPQKFQLIKPDMVHESIKNAPKQIMEVLHAVHDAEYDKALHNYQTQTRQWENYIQGNLNLFDPYGHQNITVLYTVVCTETSIPCAGPDLLTLAFYTEHEISTEIDPDCTLGQYVEDLCLTINTTCTFNGCDRKMSEHHRTYVHGEARITVFVDRSPCKIKGLQDSILMWSYCKKCQKETQVMPMSESTWKYSFGKYLELSFWSSDLHLRAGFCPHDLHRDHLRYFGFRNVAIRIHYDPIDLLEIVVPRTRITWKVDNDLRLKNELFTKIEERWNRFMTSVISRIKGINIDSVAPEKADDCKAEIERLKQRAHEEHTALLRKLQDKYMESKYYEIIPLNRAVRAMQEKVAEWDDAFQNFDGNFFPSEKDIRRLAAIQLKKMFMDRDESQTSLVSVETNEPLSDVEEKSIVPIPETTLEPSPDGEESPEGQPAAVEDSFVENPTTVDSQLPDETKPSISEERVQTTQHEGVEHLDLAIPEAADQQIASEILTPADTSDFLTSSPSEIETPPDVDIPATPSEATLSEKVERLRKANQSISAEQGQLQSETSGIPRLAERTTSRRSGASPPLNRTQSQPANTLRRMQPISGKSYHRLGDARKSSDTQIPLIEPLKSSTTEPVRPTDKRLSERLGLGSLKQNRKAGGHSLIPRSVQAKRKESKVTTLAKHFEQLSREFEKERMRDRRRMAATVTQSRAFPKASSKPIVEIYKDINEAVEERGPPDEVSLDAEPTHISTESTSMTEGLAKLNMEPPSSETQPNSPNDTSAAIEGAIADTEADDSHQNFSQTGSDDEGVASDADHSLIDLLPDAVELAESLRVGKPNADLPLEIPKHEKSSLMKMLTNFWAERSASGWTQLEYPINAGEHIFVDSDVIIREDEPSSLIAFTLSSEHYRAKLNDLRQQGPACAKAQERDPMPTGDTPDICEDGINQAEVETSLLRATGTHLAYSFVDSSARMQCKIFFAEQFDAVRRKCGVADRIIESLSRCLKWDSKGGKTKSVFLKTLDDRLVLKQLSQIETQAFLKFAPAYFNIISEALFHELPTAIAKMLGFFQIVIKNPATGTEIKWDVLVMENLFYDRSPTRIFDLKGSMRNRKIQSTGEQNEVLLDENMVEFIYESPLFAREHSKKLLRSAIFNDTLFLQRNDVMDYSLMVAVDEARKELVVGIIDVVRTYTWDKKLESWIKDRGFAGGGRNRPTVTSPKEYKSRFREAMNRYILQAPNSWHQPLDGRPGRDSRQTAQETRTPTL
ncbi:Mitochondrial distribution and morphology protein 12 [Ciborinia camelliae]|nr:Mitochondrial distribution and morphology protein 12 [Ciborinia camelliae]